jgi:hypothetical protein
MRLMVILRSACCGIAVVVVSAPVGFSVLTWDAARRVPESVKASIGPGEALGFELGPLIREHPVGAGAWLVAAFAVGFFAGVAGFWRRGHCRVSHLRWVGISVVVGWARECG